MDKLRKTAGKVDEVIFQIERVLLLISLTMMTVLVSLDVIQRTFSRPVGKTESVILSLFYTNPTDEQTAFVTGRLGPGFFGLFGLVFFILATQSSRSISAERIPGAAKPGLGKSIIIGAVVFASAVASVKTILWVFPSSVPGAQKFALGFMLWSGMLGASLATKARRHIVIDVVKKNLDASVVKPYALLGGLVTFGFCAFLALLGTKQFLEQYREWSTGDGVGIYDALPIPLWISTLAIPVTFATMAVRFLAQGIHDFIWGAPTGGTDAHGIDLEALEKEKIDLNGGTAS